MKKLSSQQLSQIEGDGLWGGFACGLAVIGVAALFTNPVTGTAAAMGSGALVGGLVGACAGLLYFVE
jgi:hypothetical protein